MVRNVCVMAKCWLFGLRWRLREFVFAYVAPAIRNLIAVLFCYPDTPHHLAAAPDQFGAPASPVSEPHPPFASTHALPCCCGRVGSGH